MRVTMSAVLAVAWICGCAASGGGGVDAAAAGDTSGDTANAAQPDSTGSETSPAGPPETLLDNDGGAVPALALEDGALWWVHVGNAQAFLLRGVLDAQGKVSAADAQTLDQAGLQPDQWWVPGHMVLAGSGERLVLWTGAGTALRWADAEGAAGPVATSSTTDVDAEGDLIVFTETNAGRVAWTTPTRLRAGQGPEAEAQLEYPTGVATDGTRTWVIDRLKAVLMRYDAPGAEPTQVAFWAGDNTMDMARGPTDLVWWNHATGRARSLPLSPGEGTPAALTSGYLIHGAGLVVTSTQLYFVEGDDTAEAVLWRAPLDGSAERTQVQTLGLGCRPALGRGPGDTVLVAPCDGSVVRL